MSRERFEERKAGRWVSIARLEAHHRKRFVHRGEGEWETECWILDEGDDDNGKHSEELADFLFL